MIHPVNDNLIIEPIEHPSFVPTEKGMYEEIGIVVESYVECEAKKGDKVFFDSWLAGKYPTGKGKEYLWLVNWGDIKAVEPHE